MHSNISIKFCEIACSTRNIPLFLAWKSAIMPIYYQCELETHNCQLMRLAGKLNAPYNQQWHSAQETNLIRCQYNEKVISLTEEQDGNNKYTRDDIWSSETHLAITFNIVWQSISWHWNSPSRSRNQLKSKIVYTSIKTRIGNASPEYRRGAL